MTVQDLINALLQYPPEMEVEIWKGWCTESQQDYYADLDDLEITEENKLSF